jgi:hypothetical protein
MSTPPPTEAPQPPPGWYQALLDAALAWVAQQILPRLPGYQSIGTTIHRDRITGRIHILFTLDLPADPENPATLEP